MLGNVEVYVDFDMPSDVDIRDTKIAKFREDITKHKADCQMIVDNIEDRIQQLMALEAPE